MERKWPYLARLRANIDIDAQVGASKIDGHDVFTA